MKCEECDKALLIAQAQVQFANQMTDFAANLIIGQALNLVTKRIDSNREKYLQIARLEDRLEFASEQADTFAKALVRVYDLIEELQDEEDIIQDDLKKIKNSIPESALRRAE